jgi:hypothetical protein
MSAYVLRTSSLDVVAVLNRLSNLAFLLQRSSTSTGGGGEEEVEATPVTSIDDAGELARRARLRGAMGGRLGKESCQGRKDDERIQ